MASPSIMQLATDTGTIRVSGRVDFDSVLAYREMGEDMIQSNTGSDLSFDLANAEISGNIGVSLLLCWLRCANNLGQKVAFTQIPENLCEMIRVSGVEQILTFD
ncbi:MAG: STAS domain-containing protein [Pseudomonadales bacterium]|jgi:phospholipid transport system transporter-binding protein|nr:STAS domain-containing protein [Pseudomonadales bacterium]